jgi:hypothetical protein
VNGQLRVAQRHDRAGRAGAPWRRVTRGESRWPAALAVMAASGLQMALPRWLSFGPHWLLPVEEIGLPCALKAMMMLQSAVSVAAIVLVIARAVNIIG